ncbi:MAG: SDR family oxidoreductase [bacterium]|nr:NAD-dependent epimerase [Deltaproteobacteria bacterium]MCP4903845.1 SDR family oxidoreductase [bacterium]
MGTIAITGAASGIGAATAARLTNEGHRVIGVDLHKTDITADLSAPEGRQSAIDQILDGCGGTLDGFVPCAGLSGLPDRPGSLLVSLNYFGSVELIEGLRGALARSEASSVVGLCSNSTTTAPGLPMELVEALTNGDEEAARAIGDKTGSIMAYPATKMALARWIRKNSVSEDWIGQGINLNAIAPGKTETAMVAEGRADPILGKAMDLFPMPIGRDGRPEEIASMICYLLGPEARFIVGSVFFIDGGTDALLRPNDFPSVMPVPV